MDLLDERDSGDTQEGGASNGDSRFRHKKSKVWAEYKPVYVNGVLRAECRRCHVHVSCRGGHFGRHYKICKAKEGQQPQDDGLQYGVEPFYEHNNDDIQAGVIFDGDSEFRNMKSKLWDEYKPIFVNGVIRKGECRYCHLHLSCFGGQFWRHHKICRAKEDLGQSLRQLDADLGYDPLDQILPDSLDDTNLVTLSENRKACSTLWKDNVGGRNDGAEYVRSHQRISAGNETVSHLNQHNQPCQVRGGTIINDQKSVFLHSSVPSSKSRLQDELSSVLANGKVQNPDCVSKFLKGSSGKRIPVERHIPPSPPLEKMDRKEQSTSSAQSMLDTSRKFDQEASCQELTRMIISHGCPLSIVEQEEMRSFVKSLNPAFNMVSSFDIEEYSTILFQKEKADLKRKIALCSHRVSISACLWAPHGSQASVKYICLSVHFIDSDWKLQRKIIKFDVFQPSITNLDRRLESESGPFNAIREAIIDWNLDQKLFSLKSVSEIRNDERTSKLKDFLLGRKCLPIGGELYNTSCVSDVLDSIISKGQPMLHLAADILERSIRAYMSSSLTQQQLTEFKDMEMKCPEDNTKWWHQIYFGLEVLLNFKKAFPSEELLSVKETKIVESVCKILRAFYHAVEVICGPVCPTANVYFNELWIVRRALEEEASTDNTELSSMVWEMQEVFDEYWQNSYVWLSIPVVLDPRFKVNFIEFRLKQAFGTDAVKYVSAVHDTIWELFLEYCNSDHKLSVHTSNREVRDIQFGGFYKDSLEVWDEHLNVHTRNQVLAELTNYLDDAIVPRKDDFDILNWWMNNSTKYPTLSIMARDVLAMPASAVHCETAFSSEGPVIHKQWSTLNIKQSKLLYVPEIGLNRMASCAAVSCQH